MTRVDLRRGSSAPFQSMMALEKAVEETFAASGLDPLLGELVKIRASQINGCAHCLRMHVRDATTLGETPDRLAVVAAWRETQYFTPAEQAALALTERVTYASEQGRHDADTSALTDEQVAAVTWAAIAINAWNRIAVESGTPVGP